MTDSGNPSRWVAKAVFVASLVLNVALAWRVLTPPEPGHSGRLRVAPVAVLQRVAENLPPADATVLRQAVTQREAALRNAQRLYETELMRALETISREPFDANATAEAIKRARDARQRVADELFAAIVDALQEMSPEGRRALAVTGQREGAAQ